MTPAEAEARFHASLPHPSESRTWRVTGDCFTWCSVCGTDSTHQYDSPAEAADAAVAHTQTHQEVRDV